MLFFFYFLQENPVSLYHKRFLADLAKNHILVCHQILYIVFADLASENRTFCFLQSQLYRPTINGKQICIFWSIDTYNDAQTLVLICNINL